MNTGTINQTYQTYTLVIDVDRRRLHLKFILVIIIHRGGKRTNIKGHIRIIRCPHIRKREHCFIAYKPRTAAIMEFKVVIQKCH